MNIKIIATQIGLASCSYAEICEEFKEKATVVFLYYPKRDLIVLNEDNKFFEKWKEVITIYAGFTDLEKKEFLEIVSDENEYILQCFKTLNKIARIRKKYYRSKAA